MNIYEKLFDDFLDLAEFTLVRYYDGWGLRDHQGGNLGNIEDSRFRNAFELIDRMDVYIEDYLVRQISDNLGITSCGTTWGDLAKKYKENAGESDYDVLMLNALCNHPEEINLENCTHEVFSENIYTVVFSCYSDGFSVTSFHKIEDALKQIKIDANGVEQELARQGYELTRTEKYLGVEIYVADSDIYYEWSIEESELY